MIQWIKRKLDIIKMKEEMIKDRVEINRLSNEINNLVNIGVDVHFKEPHMILIYTKINGGQLRHIDIDIKDLMHLRQIVKEIKERYRTNRETWDMPLDYKQQLF